MPFTIKRIYSPAESTDGYRVLVDRLWPRGVSKETAELDLWLKDVAPSPELRQWFNHEAPRFDEFAEKYRQELDHNEAVEQLRQLQGHVTLLYGAKDPEINHARVLQDYLRNPNP